jgi:hypothetical protein
MLANQYPYSESMSGNLLEMEMVSLLHYSM